MADRGSAWILTINNPDAAADAAISTAKDRGWKVYGQLEQGESGTPHYQLCIKSGYTRFAAIKKVFPMAHIEAARNEAAVEQYVQKEATRIGALPSDESRMSMKKIMLLLVNNAYCTRDLRMLTNEEIDKVYWNAVNNILEQRPGLISLLVQPNYIRAFRYTAWTWKEIAVAEAESEMDVENEPAAAATAINEIIEEDIIELPAESTGLECVLCGESPQNCGCSDSDDDHFV